MKRIKKNAFTLVELLAVIVILAIILVIAVPKVMSIIGDAKKGTLESTAKMIASSAEKAKVQNTVLGNTDEITCESVTKLNNVDYESCTIKFEGNTAKVTIKGKGKFAGLNVCGGTKTGAEASEEECGPKAVSFEDDDWGTIVAAVQSGNHTYEVGNTKTIEMDIDGNGTAEEYTIRVANTTKCSDLQTQVTSKTACGFVLEFVDIVKEIAMRDSFTNAGGWSLTNVRAYLNNKNDVTSLFNLLTEDLRNGIIDTYVVSGHGNEDLTTYENVVDENFYSTDKLYLLSRQEVYGTSFVEQEDDTSNGTSRQLDYYANNNVSISNYDGVIKNNGESASWWWLRSAVSTRESHFFCVNHYGDSDIQEANVSCGVSPAFRLAE